MDTISPPAPSDAGKFLIENTPAYIANLVAVRNDLAERQGIENTVRLRKEADEALKLVRETAARVQATAEAKLAAAKKLEVDLVSREQALDSDRTAFETARADAEKTAAAVEARQRAKAEELVLLEATLNVRAGKMATAEADLDARITALQAKVAALAF
jgi:hypothetical protein